MGHSKYNINSTIIGNNATKLIILIFFIFVMNKTTIAEVNNKYSFITLMTLWVYKWIAFIYRYEKLKNNILVKLLYVLQNVVVWILEMSPYILMFIHSDNMTKTFNG